MSEILEFDTPAPCCILPSTHPARAHIPAEETDVAISINQHKIDSYDDDGQWWATVGQEQELNQVSDSGEGVI